MNNIYIKKINVLCKILKFIKIRDLVNITPNINKIKKNKGFIGQIVEKFFFIKNNNRQEVDIENLGIEIKTVPLNKYFLPKEKTYICNININDFKFEWKNSNLYKKLNTILWVPYQGCCKIPLYDKIIFIPFIYKISPLEEKKIKREWIEIVENHIYNKQINITSLEYLEIKIKKSTLNKNYYAYYLNKKFTKMILKKINYKNSINIYRGRDLNSHDY